MDKKEQKTEKFKNYIWKNLISKWLISKDIIWYH